MQPLGLEWTHRLITEPGRLFHRYLVDDVPFALRLLVTSALTLHKGHLGHGGAPLLEGAVLDDAIVGSPVLEGAVLDGAVRGDAVLGGPVSAS